MGVKMIYTVTFNPSLDYIVDVENFREGATNRTCGEQMLVGGKGINVSYVLRNLGIPSTALGFLAGFVGKELERRLAADGIQGDFLMLEEGVSRINVKLKGEPGTEINGRGPCIPPQMVERLKEKIKALEKGDLLVLAGSIPQSVPDTIYMDIMTELSDSGVSVVVDAAGELLLKVLPNRPFLIKPNHQELGELFGVELTTRESVLPYARRLQELGARNVLVSLGGEGALLLDENGCVHQGAAPAGRVVNPVGAGDSMVAGFLAGYLETGSYAYALKKGLAAGSASAFSEQLAAADAVELLLQGMEAD